jgi:hypothetical protein
VEILQLIAFLQPHFMTTDFIDTCAPSGHSDDFTLDALRASNEQLAAHLKQSAEYSFAPLSQRCAA